MVTFHIFQCVCENLAHFYFLSEVWRQRIIPRQRFPMKRGNSRDSRTFKAQNGLFVIAHIFRTFWPKMAFFLGGKIGEELMRYWPPPNSFLLLGVVTSVPLLAEIDQEMLSPECTQTLTETNWIHLSHAHAVCHSYGADNDKYRDILFSIVAVCRVCFVFFLSFFFSELFYFVFLLWPPYVIGQAIIFCPVVSIFFFFFPRLISAAVDWMSTILPHMVWP